MQANIKTLVAISVPVAVIAGAAIVNWRNSGRDEAEREQHHVQNVSAAEPQAPFDCQGACSLEDNPYKDGWDTEVFNSQAGKQLKKLAKMLTVGQVCNLSGNVGDEVRTSCKSSETSCKSSGTGCKVSGTGCKPVLQSLLASDFECQRLYPASRLEKRFQDGSIVVWRAAPAEESNTSDERVFSGTEGCIAALQELLKPLADATDLHSKFKLFTIEVQGKEVETQQYFSLSGKTDSGSLELNATWVCRWTKPEGKDLPRLKQIRLDEFEKVVLTVGQVCNLSGKAGDTSQNEDGISCTPSKTMFADCTQSVLGATDSFSGQFVYDRDHWAERISSVDINGYQGLALGDANGDGADDVYVCQGKGLPNRLLVRNPDGTVSDRSADAGVDYLDGTRSALFVDLDNDGDQDLTIGTASALLVMENDGKGRFSLRRQFTDGKDAFSLSAADYDNDGRVDLYVCVYYPEERTLGIIARPLPYHDANNGGRNLLLRNDGQWRFTDATDDVGLDENNSRYSLASNWEDYDNDGDVDLYVANDFGRNCLYRNDGGHFKNVAVEEGVEDQSFGMSVAWADYNRDGWMDLYVSNMFSAAGNRITFQRKFKNGIPTEQKERYQYLARGNSLFSNAAARGGGFEDVSRQAAVMMGRWSWGSNFVDVNNDGWEDLLVTNGYLTRQGSGDL